VIGNTGLHRGGYTKALVYPTKIVIREVQGASGFNNDPGITIREPNSAYGGS
jgi:hypothetical protein